MTQLVETRAGGAEEPGHRAASLFTIPRQAWAHALGVGCDEAGQVRVHQPMIDDGTACERRVAPLEQNRFDFYRRVAAFLDRNLR